MSVAVLGRRREPLGSAAGQAATLTVGRGLASVLSAAWLLVAARHLAGPAFGDLTLLLALSAICQILSDLGLQVALAARVATRQVLDVAAVRSVLGRRVILSLGCAVVVGGLYVVDTHDGSLLVPLVFTGSLVGSAIYSTQCTALRSLDRAQVEAGNEVLSRLGVVAVGSIWLLHGGGLMAAVVVYVLADVASAVVVTAVAGRHVRADGQGPPLDDLRLRRTAVFGAALVVASVYGSIDIWLLGLLKGTVVSGRYAAADRVLDGVLLPASALGAVALARVPRHVTRPERCRVALRLAAAAVAVSVPAAALGAVLARPLMSLLFGPAFAATGPVLVVLLASVPVGAIVAVVGFPASYESRRWFGGTLVAGLCANVGLNLALVPAAGAIGAAWANLAGDALVAALLLVPLLSRRPATPVSSETLERVPC